MEILYGCIGTDVFFVYKALKGFQTFIDYEEEASTDTVVGRVYEEVSAVVDILVKKEEKVRNLNETVGVCKGAVKT